MPLLIHTSWPWGEGKECGADGTHCLERFWEVGVVMEPLQPGSRPGKCSRPPQQPAWFSKNSPSWFPGHGLCTRLSPRKLSHRSRRVLHDVPDLEGCFLWSGGIGLGKGLPCAVKPAASCAPHPCARLLSLQLRRLCVLPGAGAQINISKQDLNQSHY